jgi:hypothetical protein
MRSVYRAGRRRAASGFRARFEDLEQRQCLSVTVSTVDVEGGTELVIIGNGDDDTINIADSGAGHVDVTDGGGGALGSADNVVRIKLASDGGNDTVNYALTAPLDHDQSLHFHLGQGNDQATIDLSAGVADAKLRVHVDAGAGDDTVAASVGTLSSADVDIHMNGHLGNDNLSINGAPAPPPPAPTVSEGEEDDPEEDESSLDVRFLAGPGDDTLAATIDAALADEVKIDFNGHSGDDTLSATVTGSPVPDATPSSSHDDDDGEDDDDDSEHDPAIRIRLDGSHGDDSLSATVAATAAGSVKLQLEGRGGDDELSLTTTSEEAASPASAGEDSWEHGHGPSFDAELDGGGGDDTLAATLGAIAAAHVKVDLDGGSGDDLLTLLATGANVPAGGTTFLKLDGGPGDDVVDGTFDGQVLGILWYLAEGGPGDDTLESNLTIAPGSTGIVCATSAGGSGTDDVTLNVFDNSGDGGASLLTALRARIFDPGGHDTLVHTDNVVVVLNNGHHNDDDEDDD